MISLDISMPEGTKDSLGRTIKEGDTLIMRGKFMADGKFHVDTTSDITMLTSKINIGDK